MASCGRKSGGGVRVVVRHASQPLGNSVLTPFGAPSVQCQAPGPQSPHPFGSRLCRTAGQRSPPASKVPSYSFPLPAKEPCVPCRMVPSNSTCPPHGAKAVCGRRSKMEDAYAIRDGFLAAPDLDLDPMVPSQLPTRHCQSLKAPVDGGMDAVGPDFNQSQDSEDFNNRSDVGSELYPESSTDSLHFFGVFDGHGGVEAAQHCAGRMHQNLSDVWNEKFGCNGQKTGCPNNAHQVLCSCASSASTNGVTSRDIQDVFVDAFLKTDDEFRHEDVSALVGSTAVIVLVGQRYYLVANCGDSRAVLCRAGQAHPLTVDHKPEREDEMARVEKAGGQVWFWNGARVMGVLAMSRAIGDRSLRPYVIPEPEVTIVPRSIEDTLIIIATDGLWDVVSDQEACTLAKKCLDRAQQKGATESDAARLTATVLIRAALDRGSRDNITVIVIDLRTSNTVRARAEADGQKYLTGMQVSDTTPQVHGIADHRLVCYDTGVKLNPKTVSRDQVVV